MGDNRADTRLATCLLPSFHLGLRERFGSPLAGVLHKDLESVATDLESSLESLFQPSSNRFVGTEGRSHGSLIMP